MIRWLLPGALLVAACTSFDPVARNVCGNGILEPGEDCDSPDATCVRCAVTCTTAADCPTSDYACGVDNVCHAPGGALAPPVSAGTFLVDDYRITDVDKDRIGDVVGLSKTSIAVRHGDATAQLARAESQITPSQTGPAAFGDLDGDGSLDLTVATPDGLVSYASPYGTLSPLDVGSTITDPMGNPVDVRMGFAVTPLALGVFIAQQGQVLFAVLDFSSLTSIVAAVPCHAITPAQFSPALVDVYRVNKPTDTAVDTVVAMTTAGGNGTLCVLAVHKDNLLATATITDITPANPPVLAKRPVLADLDTDTDHCPDVVTTEGGAHALRHWSGIMGLNHCVMQAASTQGGDPLASIAMSPASSDAIGHATIDPPQSGVVPDALVLDNGLWVTNGSAWAQVYASPRKLASATNADLDGDGMNDVVLSAAASDDLDVLYRASPGLALFQLYRVDTTSVVTSVTIADYDGDGSPDIAYTETIGDHQSMSVAYGSTNRVLPPIQVGTFGGILSVAPVTLPTTADPLFQIADLFVLQPNSAMTGAPKLTILAGSAQRIMIPYFDPRAQAVKNTLFRAVIAGHFVPTSGGGPDFEDVVAVASSPPSASTPQVLGWVVPGTASGLDSRTSGGITVNGVSDCGQNGGGGFCYEEATYLTWPVSASQDVVLGVDRQSPPHAGLASPASGSASLSVTAASALASAIPADNVVRSLYARDLDGDGKPDLIATFAPGSLGAGQGALLVCQVDGTGLPQQCNDLAAIVRAASPMTTACVDAAPGHFGYRDPTTPPGTGTDLVALCRDGGTTLYRVHHESDGYHADALAHTSAPLTEIRVGDVNGDGLDDVVALAGDKGAQTLVVFPQCSSRTLSTCQLGAGGNP